MIIVSPTPSVLPLLVRHLIVGISLGLVVALVYAATTGFFEWQVSVRLVNLGFLIGVLRWLLACASLTGSRDEPTVTAHYRPVHRPKPFTNRLSRFLHCPEEELQEEEHRVTFISRMRFWSRVPLDSPHRPKPAWLIREILERIRERVRGSMH